MRLIRVAIYTFTLLLFAPHLSATQVGLGSGTSGGCSPHGAYEYLCQECNRDPINKSWASFSTCMMEYISNIKAAEKRKPENQSCSMITVTPQIGAAPTTTVLAGPYKVPAVSGKARCGVVSGPGHVSVYLNQAWQNAQKAMRCPKGQAVCNSSRGPVAIVTEANKLDCHVAVDFVYSCCKSEYSCSGVSVFVN